MTSFSFCVYVKNFFLLSCEKLISFVTNPRHEARLREGAEKAFFAPSRRQEHVAGQGAGRVPSSGRRKSALCCRGAQAASDCREHGGAAGRLPAARRPVHRKRGVWKRRFFPASRFGAVPASRGGRAWLPSPRQPCRDSIFFLDSGMVGAKEIA